MQMTLCHVRGSTSKPFGSTRSFLPRQGPIDGCHHQSTQGLCAAAVNAPSSSGAHASASMPTTRTTVVLTREAGKNGKMQKALSQLGYHCLELPLIEHTAGPDKDRLPGLLRDESWDWVAVTSPEAAAVFLEGWEAAGRPQVHVAVVGGGTGEVLMQGGCMPQFTASKALGKLMGAELPPVAGGSGRVLYPASVKAGTDLQDSLASSGFSVTRISTYNTSGIKSADPSLLEQARSAQVMTYGSPSAVKAWVALVGVEAAQQQVSACIGSTSARACEAVGITQGVVFPDAPGIEGWVECVVAACKERGMQPLQGQE